ncbi:conserved hypothetical protein [Candidatus Nitrotoga sp. 1052]|nr:conserved hypothetical protein [Candidatus Nitrotoga sp. 1052]
MRNRLIFFALIAASLSLILSNWSWRWIFFNGWAASGYAKNILSGSTVQDEKFLDYIVYTSGDCVVFAEHDKEENRMAYCPKGVPSDTSQIGTLQHVVGAWYRAR